MNLEPLSLITIALVIASIGGVIYYFKILNSDKLKGARDIDVINPMTQYTRNKSKGGKLKKIHEKDGWSGVEFYPRDVDVKKAEKEGREIGTEIIFVPNNNLKWTSKGAWSGDCGVLEIIPISKNDIPEGLKNSCTGVGLILASIEKEKERQNERVETEKVKNLEEMRMDTEGFKSVRGWIEAKDEIMGRAGGTDEKSKPTKP